MILEPGYSYSVRNAKDGRGQGGENWLPLYNYLVFRNSEDVIPADRSTALSVPSGMSPGWCGRVVLRPSL